MISRVFAVGDSFSKTCAYICEDRERARIMDADGVRTHDHKAMAIDFEGQQEMRTGKGKAVFHCILSFPSNEKPSDKLMVELARKYLEGIRLVDTQYVVSLHTDTAHAHMHIVANLVNNSGKSIPSGWIGLRSKKVTQQLNRDYGLSKDVGKHLEQTHREKLHPPDEHRYRIYEAIDNKLLDCCNLKDLETGLLLEGIETRYRFVAGNPEPEGISFRLGQYCFKGSKIDQRFSIKRLQLRLSIQQDFAQWQQVLAQQQKQTLPQQQKQDLAQQQQILAQQQKQELSKIQRPNTRPNQRTRGRRARF